MRLIKAIFYYALGVLALIAIIVLAGAILMGWQAILSLLPESFQAAYNTWVKFWHFYFWYLIWGLIGLFIIVAPIIWIIDFLKKKKHG